MKFFLLLLLVSSVRGNVEDEELIDEMFGGSGEVAGAIFDSMIDINPPLPTMKAYTKATTNNNVNNNMHLVGYAISQDGTISDTPTTFKQSSDDLLKHNKWRQEMLAGDLHYKDKQFTSAVASYKSIYHSYHYVKMTNHQKYSLHLKYGRALVALDDNANGEQVS